MTQTTVCYVAGKSGGHLIPALTLAQQARFNNKIIFFSTHTALDHTIMSNYSWVDYYKPLVLDNFPRKNIFGYPRFIAQFFMALYTSLYTLIQHRPEKIVSMGGYISIPVCIAGFLLRIPIELYELNVVPGAANKLISVWAKKIYICFPETRQYLRAQKCYQTEYPLRFNHEQRISREQACTQLGLDMNKKIILVLGGSQGSRTLNELIKHYAPQGVGSSIILHQTGERDVASLHDYYQQQAVNAHVFAFKADLDICYSAADYIIARAGAGTLFEIKFFEKKALIIPLEVATTGHQVDNAYAMQTLYPQFFKTARQSNNTFNELVSFLNT